jgi:RNA polymerase sigma-70 factor (ECF subfamily)
MKPSEHVSTPAKLGASRRGGRDWRAFETLVSRHRSRLWSVALNALNDRAAAEQVLQDTFVAAWEKLSQLGAREPVSSWLLKLCAQALLSKLRLPAPLDPRLSLLGPRFTADGAWEATSGDWTKRGPDDDDGIREVVATAVANLPAEHRAAFVLRESGDLSCGNIAAAFKTTTPTIERRTHEARLSVLEAIDEHWRAAHAAA